MPDRLKLTVPLASWCSLRFGEIVELRRGDIDLEAEVIRVRRGAAVVKGGWVIGGPKTPAGLRDVSDPPHLLQMIDDHLANYVAAEPDSLLFPARLETPLEHLPWGWLHYRWKLTRKVAGREDLRFHDLRHSGLTMAAQEGATLAELMERLGHATASAALVYQHAARGRGNSFDDQHQ